MMILEQPPRRRRGLRALLIAAGLLVALVVAAAIYATTHDGDGSNPVAASPSQGVPASEGGSLSVHAPGIIGGFTDVVYKNFYGIKLPYSPTLGPRDSANGLASGFSHNEPGAVLASLHLLTRSDGTVGPAIFTPTITKQWIGTTANKQLMLSSAQENYRTFAPNGGIPGPIDHPVYIGYSISGDISADDLSVAILARLTMPDQSYALVQQTVRAKWVDGDWRLVALPGRPVQLTAAPADTAELPGQVLTLSPTGN